MGYVDDPQREPQPGLPDAATAWARPETAMPGGVSSAFVVARGAAAVLTVGGILAYQSGFQFTVTGLLRDRPRSDRGAMGWRRRVDLGEGPLATEFCYVAVEFSDGRSASNVDFRPPAPGTLPAGPLLVALGGGGAGRRFAMDYWMWPLPPPGSVTFVGAWPAHGVPETRVAVDARLIQDAAAGSIEFWSHDPAN